MRPWLVAGVQTRDRDPGPQDLLLHGMHSGAITSVSGSFTYSAARQCKAGCHGDESSGGQPGLAASILSSGEEILPSRDVRAVMSMHCGLWLTTNRIHGCTTEARSQRKLSPAPRFCFSCVLRPRTSEDIDRLQDIYGSPHQSSRSELAMQCNARHVFARRLE